MKKLIILFTVFFITLISFAQQKEENNTKTGWNFGLLPVVSYNSDLGFQYGVLTNVYNYGDGKVFPKYYHSIYAEVSRYTKGSGIYRLFYDSEFLIPNIRLTADVSYLPDQAIDFFGFNGYQAVYNQDWENDSHNDYKSRMYYNHERNIFRVKVDFRGKTGVSNLNWAAGYDFLNVKVNTVPIDKLNAGKDSINMLPKINTLYDDYVDWGIIKTQEAKGGLHHNFKLGVVYDTRDNEPCPMSGIWTEIVLFNSFNKDFKFGKLAFTHRQYFTIIPQNLSLTYRLGYQGIVYGHAPFYLLPYMVYSYLPSSSIDGLGGSKSVRGLIRNRLVADGVVYGNVEMRWKFVRFKFIKQNWYAALNPFFDFGRTVQNTKLDKSGIPSTINQLDYFDLSQENFHFTYGAGLHLAMNENFVIAAEIGLPMDKRDGKMGIYIGMNWLF